MREMKAALEKEGLERHLIVQPVAYHTPELKYDRIGLSGLPEFPLGKGKDTDAPLQEFFGGRALHTSMCAPSWINGDVSSPIPLPASLPCLNSTLFFQCKMAA